MSAGISARRTRRESLGRTSARYSTGLMSASAQQPSTVYAMAARSPPASLPAKRKFFLVRAVRTCSRSTTPLS
jgi:hypothetical protein